MKALDLFAGAGGWSLACRNLGIEDHGVENMKEARATRAAAGFQTVHDDVETFNLTDTRRYDGLIASPPCQTFSQAGKGEGRKSLDRVLLALKYVANGEWPTDLIAETGDPRTGLVLQPLRYALEILPKWLAFEQVPTVLPVWQAMAEALEGFGYATWVGYVFSEQHGTPQTRKRALLLARRDGRGVGPPKATHSRYYSNRPARPERGLMPWRSWGEALQMRDAVAVSNYGTGGDPSRRGRRDSWRPFAAVTSKVDRVRIVTAGDTQREVRLSSASAGVLQDFPPVFPWQGSKTKQFLQVGNAVPVRMAEAALRAVTDIGN